MEDEAREQASEYIMCMCVCAYFTVKFTRALVHKLMETDDYVHFTFWQLRKHDAVNVSA